MNFYKSKEKKMIKCKKLDIKIPPPSLAYGHIINPLVVILAHPDTENWFYSNYIQLCSMKHPFVYGEEDVELMNFFPKYFSDFDSFYLRVHNITDDIIDLTEDNLISHMIEWIEKGYYIQTFLNEGEIPGTYMCSHKIHALNEQLFYGYNLEEKVFYITVFNEKDHFSESVISFEALKKVFFSDKCRELVEQCEWLCVGKKYGMNLFKFKEYVKYEFNLNVVINSLEDYVNASNSAENLSWLTQEKKDFVFGVDVYKSLIDWLNLHNNEPVDIRSVFELWDHKKIMYDRIEFLINKGFLTEKKYLEEYRKIVDLSNDVRLLIIKYNIIRKRELIDRIINTLNELKNKEVPILENLIADLKRCI